MGKTIAFLFPAFPNLHQTFVLWEVLGLRQCGVEIALYSIKRPMTRTQQPEAQALRNEVHYLPRTLSGPVLRANGQLLVRSPRRYLGVYARLVREWWRDRDAGREWKRKRASAHAPEQQNTFLERLQGRFNRSAFLYLIKSLALVPRGVYLGDHLRTCGIERVHAHWSSYSTTVALVAHWLFEIPFSFTAHAYDIYVVPRLLAVKLDEADFAVTCAQVNAGFLMARARQPERVRLIVNYHGVDIDRFRPTTTEAHETPCIVTCGRLEPYKGHHVLLQACARLSQPARCIIVGEGPQRRRLEQLAVDLGIRDRVEFTGPLSQAEIVRTYRRADVFVLASVITERAGKRDVIPNVLVEAMAVQLPVVASRISGIGELVEDGVTGRLVAANNAPLLAAVIDELLVDSSQRSRLARAGMERVRADFDRRKNILQLADIFLATTVHSGVVADASELDAASRAWRLTVNERSRALGPESNGR